MDISVIVPCHNIEPYIEKCLGSILMQNYECSLFEIIAIIDSCTDDTEKIVRKLLVNRVQDKIIAVKYNRAGLSRNCGLDVATGKYVWFIDGDDYLVNPQAFSKLVDSMEKTKAAVVYLKNFVSEKFIAENWAAWRFFYLRSFIGITRFSDKPIDEDIEFFVNLSKLSGFRAIKIDDVLYHHTFPRAGSIVTEKIYTDGSINIEY